MCTPITDKAKNQMGNPQFLYTRISECTDCHTATKFISKVTGREVVATDATQFHHFEDGVCSCGDEVDKATSVT